MNHHYATMSPSCIRRNRTYTQGDSVSGQLSGQLDHSNSMGKYRAVANKNQYFVVFIFQSTRNSFLL